MTVFAFKECDDGDEEEEPQKFWIMEMECHCLFLGNGGLEEAILLGVVAEIVER